MTLLLLLTGYHVPTSFAPSMVNYNVWQREQERWEEELFLILAGWLA
jgi:hypothetical protein